MAAAFCAPLIAVAGAAQAGPALATPVANAPAGHWSNVREIPLTSLNAGAGAIVTALACASPGNCTAGGKFADSEGNVQIFVVSEVKGTWQKPGTIPGLNGTSIGAVAHISSISCPAVGDCVAAGSFGDQSGAQRPFIAESKNGSWHRPVPLTFSPFSVDPVEEFDAKSVSCATPGNCTVGLVVPVFASANRTAQEAFVVDEVNGVWGGAQAVPDTPALNDGLDAETSAVSCFSPGNCLAGGWYTHNHEHPFIATETAGSWGAATVLPGVSQLPGFGSNTSATIKSASCWSAGNCTVTGIYNATDATQGFLAVETDGTWSTSAISGPDGPSSGTNTHVTGLSCNSSGSCAIVGTFFDGAGSHGFVLSGTSGARLFTGLNGNVEADAVACAANRCIAAGTAEGSSFGQFREFVADETGGTWSAARPVGGKLTAGNVGGLVTAASCAAPGNCVIGGAIDDANDQSHAFVAEESPATKTSLTLSKTSIRFGQEQAERITVKVSPRTGGTPSGKVLVKAGSATLCTVTLAKGKGSCVLGSRKLRPGRYKVAATYGGDSVYSGSASGIKMLTVTK
ncbi:MAG TPA: Ig-like domain-containing protein [Streptosporangiaceae bacterium]|nr:Ig-like domain-containing protein [Streptosporangiaceae bacterium]